MKPLVSIKIGAGVFAPRLLPTLITLICLPVLLSLGTWQVHRLHWKQGLLAEIAERSHDAPVDLPLDSGLDPDYRPAKVSGTFRHDLTLFILATDLASGKGGYHVLTPLRLEKGGYLLVDRGWIPYDRKQDFAQPVGTIEIHGLLRSPSPHGLFLPKNDPAKGLWYGVDLPAMASAEGLPEFLPYVLEVAATDGGFPVGSQTRLTLPNDHFSYAVTWYSFALILLIIYGLSSYRRKTSAD